MPFKPSYPILLKPFRFLSLFLLCIPSGLFASIESLDAVSRANLPRPNSIVANGVDTATGAFLFSVNMMTTQGENTVASDLEYNSRFFASGGEVGFGWSHTYEMSLEGEEEGIMTVYRNAYLKNAFVFSNGDYEPVDQAVIHDSFELHNGTEWRWTQLDGTRTEFAKFSNNRLDQIHNKVEHFQNIVINSDGLSIFDQFNDNRGKVVHEYDQFGKLISIQDDGLRHRTLQYDDQGRLIRIVNPGETEGSTFSNKPQIDIPNGDPDGVFDTITVTDSGPIGFLGLDLEVRNGKKGTLFAKLIAPDGTELILHDRTGGSSDNLILRPRTAAFYGVERQGVWRIEVIDFGGINTTPADLDFWRLSFSPQFPAMVFSYDDQDRVTRIEYPEGDLLLANTYDALGRVVEQDDGRPETPPATFSYTPVSGGTRTAYTDRTGAVTLFDHDNDFLLERIEDPLGGVTTYTYNADGDRVTQTDPAGRTQSFGYTEAGLPRFVQYPDNSRVDFEYDADNNLTEIRDALGQRTNFFYDNRNNLTLITDPLQNVTEREYSNNSQLESIRLYAANEQLNARFVEFGYSDGVVASALHPASIQNRARVNYDGTGRIISRTDADGFRTDYVYDALDNLIEEEDPLGNITRYAYDARGRLIEEENPGGFITTFAYDGNDNLVSVTNALGQTLTYAYDFEDRLLTQTDAAGRTTRYTYDPLGRRLTTETPTGRITRYAYNAVGETIRITGPDGTVVEEREYDAMGQVISRKDALDYTQTQEFDVLGRVIRSTDPLGRITQFGYDALSRPERVIDPLGRLVENTYDSEDVLLSTTNARGHTTEYEYDAANRLAAVRTPDGEATTYLYNFRDLPVEIDFPGIFSEHFEYDAGGRLTRHEVRANGSSISDRNYTYDSRDNLLNVSGGTSELTREYDALGRMTRYTDAEGNTFEYAYNSAGLLSQLVYPDGKTVDYTYDGDDRLTSIVDWADRETRYHYDARGQIEAIDFPNGTRRTIRYDTRGAPTLRREIAADGSLIREFRYIYDAAGQLRTVESDALPSFTPNAESFTYDERNRLLTINGASIQYNERGQLTQGPLNGEQTSFGYDRFGRFNQAGNDNYGYDMEDRLRFSFENNQITYFAISPHHPLNQLLVKSPQGEEPTYYVYGVGLAYEVQGDDLRVYHYDHLGSTVALSGSDGSVVGEIEYSPFGKILSEAGQTDTPFKFHGLYGVLTLQNGLSYMRFRWYSPELRRFLSEDAHLGSLAQIESLNRFAFAHGNPVAFIDPNGQFIQTAIGAAAGFVGGVVVQGVGDLLSGELSSFEQYAGAAIGGAVTGGLLVNGVPPSIAGAAGAAVGNLTTQGLNNLTGRQDGFSFSSLATDTVIGGLSGSIGARVGKAGNAGLQRIGNSTAYRKFSKSILGRTVQSTRPKAQTFKLTNNPVFYLSRRELGVQTAERSLKGAAGAVFSFYVVDPIMSGINLGGNTSLGQAPDGSETQAQVQVQSLRSLRNAPRDIYGEFIHYREWVGALQSSGKPRPNSPNHAPTSF